MITSSSKNNKNIERKNIDGIGYIFKNQYNQNLSILKRLFGLCIL